MPSKTVDRADAAISVPLLRFLGAKPVDANDPAAGISLVVGDKSLNAVDYLHGGAISTILDVAAYLSLLPELADDEQAITHNLFVSYLSALTAGASLRATGRIIHRSRRLAFVTSELREQGRLAATAQVTKSIIAGT